MKQGSKEFNIGDLVRFRQPIPSPNSRTGVGIILEVAKKNDLWGNKCYTILWYETGEKTVEWAVYIELVSPTKERE